MAWSNSKIFRQFLADAFLNVAAFDLDSDTFKVALYDNDITPDNDVSAANSAYNAGQWTSTNNEVFEAGQWAQGGVALTSPTINVGTADVVFWDASDTASGSAADLANVYGCLVYDDTLATPVADQGICYNYFGGANSVVNGTFTVVWNANGIWRITL
ncbi:hypothetical protein C8D88_116137 [Lentzea atacamensis]|uniref:Uncharacterized protein n=1 Tax=Lentzea atacamensis TaxID=531938 RepID=A0A316HLX8_9PSEU|nr:hypothetical protein [Lentzea atacamensis]PWK81725.1 hypothetical protein C8D88_116137 [Lentzea atacamensis]